MGKSNSKVTNLSKTSITSSEYRESKIPNFIWKSKNMTFALGQKTNIIAHTTIVVAFDGTPRFTIDFGTDKKQESRAALCYKAPATVSIHTYDENVIEIKFIMESFEIENDFQKDMAANLIDVLRNIPTQCYDVIENNCRDYVAAAFLVIHAFAAQNWENFDWDSIDQEVLQNVAGAYLKAANEDEVMTYLRDVKETDIEKLKEALKIVGGCLVGVGAAAIIEGLTLGGLVHAGIVAQTAAKIAIFAGSTAGGIGLIILAAVICTPYVLKMAKQCMPQE